MNQVDRYESAQRLIQLNDVIDRRTSPYFPDDPFALLGEYLVLAHEECLFVGFVTDGPDPLFVGISEQDRQLSERESPNISDALYSESFSRILLQDGEQFTRMLDEYTSDPARRTQLHAPLSEFLSELCGISPRYTIEVHKNRNPNDTRWVITDDETNAEHVVMKVDEAYQVCRTVWAFFPRGNRFRCGYEVIRFDDDRLVGSFSSDAVDIDAQLHYLQRMRHWFASVRDIPSGRALDSRIPNSRPLDEAIEADLTSYRATLGKRIRRVGLFWNIEEATPSFISQAIKHLPEALLNAFPATDQREPSAPPVIPLDDIDLMRWVTERFETWHLQPNEQFAFLVIDKPRHAKTQADPQLADVFEFKQGWLDYKYTGNFYIRPPWVFRQVVRGMEAYFAAPASRPRNDSDHETRNDDGLMDVAVSIVTRYLDVSIQRIKDRTSADAVQVRHSLDEIRRKFTDVLDHTCILLRKSVREIELIEHHDLKPILRDSISKAMSDDAKQLDSLLGIAAAIEDMPSFVYDHQRDECVRVLVFVNLMFRRLLMETHQTLEVGFAPYFMEVGFADPVHLIDMRKFDPRCQADVEATPTNATNDAVYKVLGILEALFGIGGPSEWTTYMASAPLYGNGQRRGFLFVAGYYHRDWIDDPASRKRLERRLRHLSRLLRVNAYYAGTALQEAYDRRFRIDLSDFIEHARGSFTQGFADHAAHLCNLREAVSLTGPEGDDWEPTPCVARDRLDIGLRVNGGHNPPQKWKFVVSLLEGENERFLRSGLFPLLCSIGDAFSLRSVAETVEKLAEARLASRWAHDLQKQLQLVVGLYQEGSTKLAGWLGDQMLSSVRSFQLMAESRDTIRRTFGSEFELTPRAPFTTFRVIHELLIEVLLVQSLRVAKDHRFYDHIRDKCIGSRIDHFRSLLEHHVESVISADRLRNAVISSDVLLSGDATAVRESVRRSTAFSLGIANSLRPFGIRIDLSDTESLLVPHYMASYDAPFSYFCSFLRFAIDELVCNAFKHTVLSDRMNHIDVKLTVRRTTGSPRSSFKQLLVCVENRTIAPTDLTASLLEEEVQDLPLGLKSLGDVVSSVDGEFKTPVRDIRRFQIPIPKADQTRGTYSVEFTWPVPAVHDLLWQTKLISR